MGIKLGDFVEGELNINKFGSGHLVSSDLEKDIYIRKKYINKGLHMDKVRIEIVEGKDGELQGKVVEILERFKMTFVGTLQVTDKFAFLIPDSPKMFTDIYIPLDEVNGGKDGQKAVTTITKWMEKARNPNGKVIEVLGSAGETEVEIHSILHEYNLPYNFTKEVEEEAESISPEITEAEISKRRDMRKDITICIDPKTARDKDDAISCTILDNGHVEVGIHIADVSHYVKPGTQLDKEAYERGTSVYLVDRVVPMLPEKLSNGICSLNPNEDKLAFSAVFTLDMDGRVVTEWFGKTVVNIDVDYSYEEAQEIIERKDFARIFEDTIERKCEDAIILLDSLAKTRRKKRKSLEFSGREVKFQLDENNKPIGIEFKVQKDANKLIEEFMLLGNKRVCKYLNDMKIPMINRVHDEPDQVKLQGLKNFIQQFGYDIKINDSREIKPSLNQLIKDVKGTPEENIVNNLVIRSMQKAEYSSENIGHYGLGFSDYAHFTSPIRRYPDLILHRILNDKLSKKPSIKKGKLDQACKYLSNREVTAQKASRDSVKYMQCVYMEDKVGKVYKGVIVSVLNYGIFVEIEETKSEGLIRLNEIEGDTFEPDLDNYCLRGFNTGEVLRLGDEVTVVVKGVDIEKKNIDLTLMRL